MIYSPLVYITLLYALGIVFAKTVPLSIIVSISILGIFFCLSVIFFIQKLPLSNILLILTFLAGMVAFQISACAPPDQINHFLGKGYVTIRGVVDDDPQVKDERVSFPLNVRSVMLGKNEDRNNGKVFISVAAGAGDIQYGDNLAVRGILSQSQEYANPLLPLTRSRLFLSAHYFNKLSGRDTNIFKVWSIWLGNKFNQGLLKILPNKEASLLGSILLGSAVSPLSESLKDNYRKAGLIHLLVVSGTQVSILVGVCLALTRALRFPLWLGVIATTFFNFMLVIVTGAGASILRASIMGEITLLGLLFERDKEIYTSLALSAFILLLFDPNTLFDIGFQLSFSATWALVYIAPALQKRIPQLLAISIAPILATSPIIAFNFSQVSLGGIVSNLLVLPWVEFLTIIGFSATLLSFVLAPLAQFIGGILWLLLKILDLIAGTAASLPGAYFYIAAPSLPIMIGYYGGLVLLVGIMKREERLVISSKKILFAVIIFSSLVTWHFAFCPPGLAGEMTVTFLDVGQGDCALIEAPAGKKILIDGGGREIGSKSVNGEDDPVGRRVVMPFLQKKGINRLDLVVLSHPHDDHLGGLNCVLQKIKVDRVMEANEIFDSQDYRRFKALIERNKIKHLLAFAGEKIDLGSGLQAEILGPLQIFPDDINSDSIVMRFNYGTISFLFVGDMEKAGEELLVNTYAGRLRSTFLKVGHHGSSTSTSPDFLKAVDPAVAVISVGAHNRYRHPSAITLNKLSEAGIRIYRTDRSGAVTVRTDGRSYSMVSQK